MCHRPSLEIGNFKYWFVFPFVFNKKKKTDTTVANRAVLLLSERQNYKIEQ